jgi:hypothetical protein
VVVSRQAPRGPSSTTDEYSRWLRSELCRDRWLRSELCERLETTPFVGGGFETGPEGAFLNHRRVLPVVEERALP